MIRCRRVFSAAIGSASAFGFFFAMMRADGTVGAAPLDAQAMRPFVPTPLLANGHAMTIAAALFRPSAPLAGTIERVFTTDAETRVLALCNWQPDRTAAPTILALHGLTGSADAAYLRGLAAKAWARGFNVVRLTPRNCGNTEHLTPTLYHSGLTADCRAVLDQLLQDNLQPPFLVGYSMGGNVALKLCCELGDEAPRLLRSVVAVSPPI